MISQHLFRSRQISNLYPVYYQLAFAFYHILCPLRIRNSSRNSYPDIWECNGFTKFYARNNF